MTGKAADDGVLKWVCGCMCEKKETGSQCFRENSDEIALPKMYPKVTHLYLHCPQINPRLHPLLKPLQQLAGWAACLQGLFEMSISLL